MAWRFRWRKQGWWQEPAGWGLGMALALPGGLLAIPVGQYAGAWALPAEVAGLAIALAATVGYFVVKRHSWLLAAPLSFGLSFSVFLALIEGWSAQLKTALFVIEVVTIPITIGLVVAATVLLGRGLRRLHRVERHTARDVGEHIANEELFRDDGERIIVQAKRGSVVLRALTTVAVLAFFVAGGLWAWAVVPNVFWQVVIAVGLALLLCFGGVFAVLMLIRSVMTTPTLVINADGILDNCSMIVTGRGLLRWNETLGVQEFVQPSSMAITYRYLDIDVTDVDAINRRQPLWKRMLARVASQRQSTGFRIPRPLLDRPPSALATAIGRYINTHAPEGSWHKAATNDEVEQPGAEALRRL